MGEVFALQKQQTMGQPVLCRGAEPAWHQRLPEGAQHLRKSSPGRLSTCSLPCIAKTSVGSQIKGCIALKNGTLGALRFPFPPRYLPARVCSVYKSKEGGMGGWCFFSLCFGFNPLVALCNSGWDLKSQQSPWRAGQWLI